MHNYLFILIISLLSQFFQIILILCNSFKHNLPFLSSLILLLISKALRMGLLAFFLFFLLVFILFPFYFNVFLQFKYLINVYFYYHHYINIFNYLIDILKAHSKTILKHNFYFLIFLTLQQFSLIIFINIFLQLIIFQQRINLFSNILSFTIIF